MKKIQKFAHFDTLEEIHKSVARPRRLPNRNIPKIEDVLKEHNAAHVLNPDGSIKHEGAHIDSSPAYWVRNKDGSVEKRIYSKAQPKAGATPAGAVFNYSPALPADIGNVQDMSQNLLFANGSDSVRASGTHQWAFADCWYLAPLLSISIERPELRGALIAKQSDGSYMVTMKDFNGNTLKIKINGQLGDRGARPSPITGEIWVCLMEKAEAFARYQIDTGNSPNTYASTEWGFPGEAFNQLGFGYNGLSTFDPSLVTSLRASLALKNCIAACTYGTTDGSVIGAHCYAVYSCELDGTIVVVNPWGVDATGSDGNDDGFVTLSMAQFRNNFGSIASTTTTPDVPVAPADPIAVLQAQIDAQKLDIQSLKNQIAKARQALV